MDRLPELTVPDISQAKCILAIQPHYDDNDIAAGGTLHTLALKGAQLIYLTVTDDLAGVSTPELSREQSIKKLQDDQNQAGALIGVQKQIRLGFPDAGKYDYFLLREKIITQIRSLKPDFLFTVDPWTPYETHNDHIQTGKAAAEAAILYQLPSIGDFKVIDMKDYELKGVVFYNTAYPNLTFDITEVLSVKQEALRSYTAQFTSDGLERLILHTTLLAANIAQDEPFAFGESLKVVTPWMLHGVPFTMTI